MEFKNVSTSSLIRNIQDFKGRLLTINNTKIKYIKIDGTDKLYKVEKISFFDFSITAMETDLKPSDVPEGEVFEVSGFKDFKISLKNGGGMAKIIEFPGR